MTKTERIIRAITLNGIMETHEVAEFTGLKTEVCERILRKLEDTSVAVSVGDGDEWMLT